MPSVHQILKIASRYYTAMADAMIAACVAFAAEHGIMLAMPERSAPAQSMTRVEATGDDGVDWQRMVERNSDTRHLHM